MDTNNFFGYVVWLLIMGGGTIFVIQPFLKKSPKNLFENYYEETPLSELQAKKDALYQSIKDAEFDFKTAKLSDGDYDAVREKLEREAVAVLEEIESKEKKKSKKNLGSISGSAKKKSPGVKCPRCGEKNKPGSKFCVGCGGTINDLNCKSCGFEYKIDDTFCPGCGDKLANKK